MRLGDVCTKIGSGATPKGGKESYRSEGIPIIRSQNVLDWSFNKAGIAYLGNSQANALANAEVRPHDILLNITGDSVARSCMAPDWCVPARVNQHVAIIRPSDSLDPTYLLCFLQSIKPTLHKLASSGATRNALTKRMIESLEIILPPIRTQRAVAAIIGTIQRKIALNIQINDYLTSTADARFNVLIAAGAEEVPLSQAIDILSGGTPKTKEPSYWEDGTIPFFGPGDARNSAYVLNTEKHITELGLGNCNSSLYPIGTVFLTARGTVGKVAVAGRPMAMNQSCFALSGIDWIPQTYVYQITKRAVKSLRAKANGATFAAINTRDLRSESIPMLPRQAIETYDGWARPLFALMLANEEESLRLASLRDALLPRLMSGEIDISQVELPTQPNNHLYGC